MRKKIAGGGFSPTRNKKKLSGGLSFNIPPSFRGGGSIEVDEAYPGPAAEDWAPASPEDRISTGTVCNLLGYDITQPLTYNVITEVSIHRVAYNRALEEGVTASFNEWLEDGAPGVDEERDIREGGREDNNNNDDETGRREATIETYGTARSFEQYIMPTAGQWRSLNISEE